MRKSERLSKLIDSVNTRLDKSVTNARTAYEDVLNEYGGAVAHLLQERGITGYDLRVAAAQGLLDEGKALFDETAEREKALGGDKRMKFTDWWVKNDSKDTNNILGKGKKKICSTCWCWTRSRYGRWAYWHDCLGRKCAWWRSS
jgi:hypothetical protein